jgi:LemA protein
MDLIARELIETGYLHNHARMWWASFWIHVEKLPWELGADFFFRHLLDADPASNTLSWRWVAGLQTRDKSYLVRLSNIEKYAPDYLRGNAAGSERLADGAVIANVVEDIGDLSKQLLVQYPTALGQTSKRTGLWLHPDDLTPEKVAKYQQAQQGLSSALSRLMVVSENYPNLKANQNFLDLQSQLEGTENRITVERMKFNESVQDYNTYIQKFPTNLTAKMFNFDKKGYFEAEASAQKAPPVQF